MQYRNAFFGFALAAVSMMVTFVAPQVRASEIWHNDWIVQAPPQFRTHQTPWGGYDKDRTTFGFAASGDVIIVAARNLYDEYRLGYQFVSVGASGDLRWFANSWESFASRSGAYTIRPDAEGGAFIALAYDYQGDDENRVVHYDNKGNLTWARSIATGWLATPASNRLASLGCSRLTMLDAGDGHVLWEKVFNQGLLNGCRGGLVSDLAGNLYAGVEIRSDNNDVPTGFKVIKFDIQGNQLWDVTSANAKLATVVGASVSYAYVRTGIDLRALRSTDGSTAWTIALPESANVVMSGGSASEPIVIDVNSVNRINGDSGQDRWNQPMAGLSGTAGVVGSAIAVVAGSSVAKIDLASGAVAWTVSTPAVAWDGFGGANESSFVGIARANWGNVSSTKRIALNDGAMSEIPLPEVANGIDANTVVDSAGDLISAGMILRSDTNELRVRRVDATDGTVEWEVADTIPRCCITDWSVLPPGIATRSGEIAIAFSSIQTCIDPLRWEYGQSIVSMREDSNGSERWQAFLYDDGEGCTQVSKPIIDEDGDVYVTMASVVQTGFQGSYSYGGRQTLYKLAAQTGAVLWRLDQDVNADFYLTQPQYFSLVGSDVLLQAPFSGLQDTIRRVSGVDGSTIWSSNVFHENGINDPVQVIDSSHVAVFSGTSTEVDWASIDIGTGQTEWTASAPRPVCTPWQSCSQWSAGLAAQPNGDTVTGGEFEYAPSLTRYRNDGSGIADRWNPGVGNNSILGAVSEFWFDAAGALKLNLYRGFSNSQGSLRFLSTFDYANGVLGGKQAIYSFTPDAPWVIPTALRASTDGRLLASTLGARSASPTTSGATLLDTSVTAHGNLAVVLTVDHTNVQPGQLLGFHLTATYAGDVPLTGVRLAAEMPWQGGIIASACSVPSCTLDTSRGDVEASFDIAPGGSVDITGQVRVLDQPVHPTMSARTWGPLGLSEQDILDNFAQASITQSLFANGFDE